MGMPVQSNARKHALEHHQCGMARRAAGKSHHHRRYIKGGYNVKASRTAFESMPWALRHAAVQATMKRPHSGLDETRKLSGCGTADTVAAHTKSLADAGTSCVACGQQGAAHGQNVHCPACVCTWWQHGVCRLMKHILPRTRSQKSSCMCRSSRTCTRALCLPLGST